MQTNMIVKEFLEADLEPLIGLWESCDLVRPWNDPTTDIRRAMGCDSSTILLGFLEEELVASAMVGFDGHRGWVYYVAVSSAHRKRGLGKEILSAAEDWLKGRGVPKSMLMVRRTNVGAVGFYESVGYAESEVVTFEKWLRPGGKGSC